MKISTNRLLAFIFLCCAVSLSSNAFGQCAAGESETIIDIATASFPEEVSWELLDASSTVIASAACGSYTSLAPSSSDTLCLTDGATYTLNAFDDWGDGWNGGTYTVTVAGVVLNTSSPSNGAAGDGAAGCAGDDLEESYVFIPGGPILGCTDSTATNYNPAATVDDGSCTYPSTNDDCANAIDIAVGSCVTGDLIGATFNPADTANIDPTCAGLSSGTALDIWFTVTVPASGNLEITLPVVPGFSSTLQFMTGPCGSLAALALPCSNYGSGGGVTLTGLTGGSVLYIRYFDFGNDQEGAYEICAAEPVSGCTDPCASNYDPLATVDDGSCTGGPVGAGDDMCATATALSGPGTYEHYNALATPSDTVDITSCTLNDVLDVWYSYPVPTGLDTFRVYTCGSSYDTGLSFWDACGGTELACNDDGTIGGIGSTCDGANFQSMIELTDSALAAIAGTTIYIRVAGYNGATGCGDLIIDEIASAGCTAATSVTNLAATVGASTLDLTWDAVPGSVGCQVNYGPSGGPFFGTQNIFGPGVSSATVPLSIIPAGNYQLRVRCGCQISPTIIATGYSNIVQITVPSPRLGEFAEVTLSPNPATDMINLAYNGAADQNVSFSIVNIIGSEVANITTDVVEGLNNFQFDLSNMESGMYFLQITSGEGSFSEQFEVIK